MRQTGWQVCGLRCYVVVVVQENTWLQVTPSPPPCMQEEGEREREEKDHRMFTEQPHE